MNSQATKPWAAQRKEGNLLHSRGIEIVEGAPVYTETHGLNETKFSFAESDLATAAGKRVVSLKAKLKDMQFKALGLLKDAGIPALDILSLEAFREYRLHNSSLFPPGYLLDDFQERYGSLTPAERLMAFTVELAARHGMHSPVTLAMQFLGSVKTLRDCLDDSQFLHAIAMAEVWRAFHFEIFGEHKLAVSGHKVREGAKRGGRQNSSRDVIMARKFQQRRNKSELSDTALKVKIGAEHRLTRSAGINAINRGLKKIVL